jgi:hypothetical protein
MAATGCATGFVPMQGGDDWAAELVAKVDLVVHGIAGQNEIVSVSVCPVTWGMPTAGLVVTVVWRLDEDAG